MDAKIYRAIKIYKSEILTTPYEVEYDVGIHCSGIYFIDDLWLVDIE